jgi:hypothetical protein
MSGRYFQPQAFVSLKLIDDGDVIDKKTMSKDDIKIVQQNPDGSAMVKISKELNEFLQHKFLR